MRGLPIFSALLVLAGLAACSTLNLPTARALRQVDILTDDVGALIVALDLPSTVAPLPFGVVITIIATTPSNGERLIEAALAPADAEAVIGSLPPPGRERAYYLFGFSDDDKAKLAEAQSWARSLPGGFTAAGGDLSLSVDPQLCALAAVDPAQTQFSVLIALPGASNLEPLFENARLADLLARSNETQLPACGER
jgi:hypothetical protein